MAREAAHCSDGHLRGRYRVTSALLLENSDSLKCFSSETDERQRAFRSVGFISDGLGDILSTGDYYLQNIQARARSPEYLRRRFPQRK
jgi:hypothetical protein